MVYLKEAFAELWRQDGLVVMARGLGVNRLLEKFLLLHCMHGDVPQPSPVTNRKYDEQEGKGEDDGEGDNEKDDEEKDEEPVNSTSKSPEKTAVIRSGVPQGRRTSPSKPGDRGTSITFSDDGNDDEQLEEQAGEHSRERSEIEQQQRERGGGRGEMLSHQTGSKKRRRDVDQSATSSGERGTGIRPLVLCINTTGEEDLFLDALMADGVPPNRLPEVVDAECTPGQRQSLYKYGGVFMVTSRVLIVDLLNKTVLPRRISGMLVHKAHRVVETSTEAFILRIFREGNPSGFVKGFTDEPESLLAGFGKLEKILRNLGVAKVYLWPRFHSLVAETLERNPPGVEELVQGLTGPTKEVQQAIVVLMDHTLRELRGSAPSLDGTELTVENCIFASFDRSVKRQLEPEWHRVGFKTKQLLQDLKTLRSLLDYVFRYDAVTFYQLLLNEKSKAAAVRDPPLWIGTTAADRLFVTAKARIYKVIPKGGNEGAVGNSKKKTRAVPSPYAGGGVTPGGRTTPSLSNSSYELSLVLEENAKWRLAADVLKEIRDVYDSRRRKASEGCSDNRDEGVFDEGGVVGGARVLVLVRDEHTCTQLRQHSSLGGSVMMKKRFIEFIRDAEERNNRKGSRRGRNNRGGRGGGGRWGGGKYRGGGGGMTGVGIGASPAFSHSSRGDTSREGTGDADGDDQGNKGVNLERNLLRRAADSLEAELATVFARRQFRESEDNSSFRGQNSLATAAQTKQRQKQQHLRFRGVSSKEKTAEGVRDMAETRPGCMGRKPKRKSRGKGKGRAEQNGAMKNDNDDDGDNDATGDDDAVCDATGDVIDGDATGDDVICDATGEVIDGDATGDDGGADDIENEERNREQKHVGSDPSPNWGTERLGKLSYMQGERTEGRESRGKKGLLKSKRSVNREGGNGCETSPASGGGERHGEVWFQPLPSLHVVVFSYAQAGESLNILQDIEPDFVLLYDPDAAFVRKLEAYQSTRPRDRPPLTVYFMLYEQSVEEQRYLTSLDRETKAFKKLIEEKARMTVPVRTITSAAFEAERPIGGGTVTRLSAPSTGGQFIGGQGNPGGLVGLTRRGGGAGRGENKTLRVVVDLREFRSVLPNLLHQRGFELVPLVIAVGDYVLTPEICVERKSLSDLFQSMSSGRLFNQVESILKHYKVPVLLIEFNPEKAFCLLGAGDLTPDIKISSITSQLTLLTIHFPQLRILWSKSEHATADMFKELMKNNAPVDVAKAQAAGGEGADEDGPGGGEAAAAAKELLMRLPGINVHNYRNVLREVDTIADLSKLTEEQLRPMLGTGNASKLYKFFRQPAPL